MTQTLAGRRAAVSVDELKRAWTAVAAGQFRTGTRATHGTHTHPAATTAGPRWEPGEGERVLPVLGCAGSCGATTIALALASSAAPAARVVECASVTASGLATASTAELGLHESGWTRGTRDDVLLERASDVLVSLDEIPIPSAPDRPVDLTLLDVGWEIGQVAASPAWLGEHVRGAALVVLVTNATVPGLRRLEGALDLLTGTSACAAVVGPSRKKWPRPVGYSAGPLTRALDQAGRLVTVPQDRALSIAGLDATPLPAALLAAAATLLALLLAGEITTEGSTR